jgi:hypothetical protein
MPTLYSRMATAKKQSAGQSLRREEPTTNTTKQRSDRRSDYGMTLSL